MRFDTPVYFLTVKDEYNKETGNYDTVTVTETLKRASVTCADIATLKVLFGTVKQGTFVIRLQRPYKKPFNCIRLGEKLYTTEHIKPLRNKTVFIVSEVENGINQN